MSNQFTGCPLSRRIIPRNPSKCERGLSLALELALDLLYSDHDSVTSHAYKYACDAWNRGRKTY